FYHRLFGQRRSRGLHQVYGRSRQGRRRAGQLHPSEPGRNRAAMAAHSHRDRAHRIVGRKNPRRILPRDRHHPVWQGRGRGRPRYLHRVVAGLLAARHDHRHRRRRNSGVVIESFRGARSASPESIITKSEDLAGERTNFCGGGYGFRAPRSARPRNDETPRNDTPMNMLFTPARIGPIEIKNRIVMPPMTTRTSDAEGFVTDDSIAYYMARVRGGTGLITVEMASPEKCGRHRRHEIGIYDDRFLPGLARLVGEI